MADTMLAYTVESALLTLCMGSKARVCVCIYGRRGCAQFTPPAQGEAVGWMLFLGPVTRRGVEDVDELVESVSDRLNIDLGLMLVPFIAGISVVEEHAHVEHGHREEEEHAQEGNDSVEAREDVACDVTPFVPGLFGAVLLGFHATRVCVLGLGRIGAVRLVGKAFLRSVVIVEDLVARHAG